MTDLDHEAAEQLAAGLHVADGMGQIVSSAGLNLARCYQASRAREAELEALFQQHHGVHVSWVAVDAKHRERIARLEALVRKAYRCRRCHGDGKQSWAFQEKLRDQPCPDCAGSGLVEAARKELTNG